MRMGVAAAIVAAALGIANWAAGEGERGAGAGVKIVMREDLSGTKYPHGEVVVPAIGSEAAKTGYLLRFSDGRLGSLPAVMRETTVADLLAQARKEQSGDVFYSPKNGGTLVVVSGKAKNLGSKYLYEVGGVELERPKEIVVAEGHTPGALEGIKEGEVYLVEKTDGCFAVLRVLRKAESGVWLEWVAETDGGAGGPTFGIVKGMMVSLPVTGMGNLTPPPPMTAPAAVPATAPARSVGSVEPTTRGAGVVGATTALAPYMGTFLRERQAMIEMRLKMVGKEAKTDQEIAAKAEAMDELGQLGAQEAVGPLIEEISFVNLGAKKYSIGTMHPAVQALKAIGKAGSAGAIKAIGELNLETGAGNGGFLKTPEYKVHLLTLVIKGVEGSDVAEYLLKREAKKADEGHRKMYELGQAYLQQPED